MIVLVKELVRRLSSYIAFGQVLTRVSIVLLVWSCELYSGQSLSVVIRPVFQSSFVYFVQACFQSDFWPSIFIVI